jgi:hypothetical protein
MINNNEVFLKHALQNQIFTIALLNETDVIETILELLEKRNKTEQVLNIMLFANFSRWEQKYLKRFIDQIKGIVFEGHEENRLLLSYNPIMIICISCTFLDKIGNCKPSSLFRNQHPEV